MQRTIAMFIVSVLMSAAAHAQAPATTFAELPRRLSVGETVFVTNQAGRTVKGTVQQVSDTVLVVRSGSDELTLTASDILRIARRGHTLRNGAVIGLATGFVVGGTLAAVDECTYTCFSNPVGVLAFGGLFGAVGMGVGAAVGASLRREHVVFERAATGRPQAAVTPLLPRGGAGLQVQIAW